MPDTPALMILDARDALRQARSLLLDPTPRNIDLSCLVLSRATLRVEALQAVLAASDQPDRGLIGSATVLRAEVEGIARLLDCAALFHSNIFERMARASSSAELPAAAPPDAVRHVQLSA